MKAISIVIFCCYVIPTREEYSDESFADEPPADCIISQRKALDSYNTVEDFDRCAPFLLPERARIYYQGAAGRQFTLRENRKAFERLRILPRALRDVSDSDLSVSLLGERISMPIGASPVAYQRLASFLGEIDTVRAVSEARTVMILSVVSTTLLEDVADANFGALLWMNVYIFPNRSITLDVVRRAENYGFHAIVVTVDSPILGSVPIDASDVLGEDNPRNLSAVNVGPAVTVLDLSVTFDDLAWLVRSTRLPVVAKGILNPNDALQAAKSGVAAILVSNHGGRQLDYTPATIEVLPKIVSAINRHYPDVEVYMDGGIRNGFDVFKALARGARAVFIGRPVIWGLAAGGRRGVRKVFEILRTELNQTMLLAGTPNVHSITKDMVFSQRNCEYPKTERQIRHSLSAIQGGPLEELRQSY